MTATVVPVLGWSHLLLLGILFLVFAPGPWRRGAGRRREWEHAERMKALEMGRALPGHDSLWPRALTCIAIGAGTPVGVFVVAWLASGIAPGQVENLGVIWGVAFLVATVAVVCGTGLAFALLGSGARAGQAGADPTAKPPSPAPELFEAGDLRG